jgi:hypothetical protein
MFLGSSSLAIRQRVDCPSLGSDKGGEGGVGGGEWLACGEGSSRGNAVGEADCGTLAVVPAGTDPSSFDG